MSGDFAERIVRLETKQEYTDKKFDSIINKIDNLATYFKSDNSRNDERLEAFINNKFVPINDELNSLRVLIPFLKYPKVTVITLIGLLTLLGINIIDKIKELFL